MKERLFKANIGTDLRVLLMGREKTEAQAKTQLILFRVTLNCLKALDL